MTITLCCEKTGKRGPRFPSPVSPHCGTVDPDACLEMATWRQHWSPESWRKFLEAGETEGELSALRRCTHAGRPLGSAEFVQTLEHSTARRLVARKGGRPRKPVANKAQQFLTLTP